MSKKKVFAGLLTSAMAATILLTTAVPAKAAVPPQGVRIEGAGSVQVGKTIELDTNIYPDDDLVSSWDVVWTSKKPSVLKVLNKRGDDTRVKGLKAGKGKSCCKDQRNKHQDDKDDHSKESSLRFQRGGF